MFDALSVTEKDNTEMNTHLMERIGRGNADREQEESSTPATVSIPTEAHAVDAGSGSIQKYSRGDSMGKTRR